jgi:arsenate reductase
MKIYHNPRCSKSRQTLQILRDKNIEVEIVEYLKDLPNKEELSNIIQILGITPIQLVRKSEPDFKENFKGKDLSDEQWIDAMIQYPKLIERPIVVKDKKAVLGRPPENVLDLI